MTYRRFADRAGREWEVWQVVPPAPELRRKERRVLPDRRKAPRPLAPERRIGDRRVAESTPRMRMSAGFERGWLCFSAGPETRRLAPIPAGWTSAGLEQLEQWVAQAKAVWKRPL